MTEAQGGEAWYFEQLKSKPDNGVVHQWRVDKDGLANIFFQPDSSGLSDTDGIPDRLGDLGIHVGNLIPVGNFTLSFEHPGHPAVLAFFELLTDSEAMLLCALKEKKPDETVFDYFEEVRSLGELAVDNPNLKEELQLLKNPFRDVKLMVPALAGHAEILFEQLRSYDEVVALPTKLKSLQQAIAKLRKGEATRAEIDELRAQIAQFDTDLDKVNLEIMFAKRHDASKTTCLEERLSIVELVTGLPPEHNRGWIKMRLFDMTPAQLAEAKLILGFNANYAFEVARRRTHELSVRNI